MLKSRFVQYYVEGEDEQKLVNTLKTNLRVIRSGKVHILNMVNQEITNMRLRTLVRETMVVLVFDSDSGNVNILNKNLRALRKCSSISEIVLIPQVGNLEEELVRSCNIKRIEDLLNSKSRSDFKSDLIHVSNLGKKLLEHEFDIRRFWSETPAEPYQGIENQSSKIKIIT